MPINIPAKLILFDGTVFQGFSFGARRSASGEVVFNTAMTGYPESLTDPSYCGQILVTTYPLIGNYGVPPASEENGMMNHFESSKVHITALVISDYSAKFSHWNAGKSLSDWLAEFNVPGIYGVDTRRLTRIIREKGAMPAKLVVGDDIDFYDPNHDNIVSRVSCNEPIEYGNGRYRILLVDCGAKNNIIRCLLKRDTTVTRVPWDYRFNPGDYDGVLFSNGPGDPKMCDVTIESAKELLRAEVPFFGICLGSQIMALAAGADTFKLKYGHRSHNQPVILNGTHRCFITSQNHGFAVDNATLPGDWQTLFTNLNDGTCEGIRHREKPFFAVQFHPEASAGPIDTEFLFDDFMDLVRNHTQIQTSINR
jgi:carbamoyl-phosphate synthase small subunit